MKYDLSIKEERAKFLRYANKLMRDARPCVELCDESFRTLNQNSYIHVLCRILACQIGVTEAYAKQIYFKELANPNIFCTTSKDPITGEFVKVLRSTRDITISEMRNAISNFLRWAAEQGYYLPEASLEDDGTMTFKSGADVDAFHQAEIETSKLEQYL